MTTPNPALQQLKDIHLPHAVAMWPVAPGWIVLYLLTLTLLIYTIYRWRQKRKRSRAIQYAHQRLATLRQLQQHNSDNINIAAELSTLIRRTALYYFQRDAIAGLSGKEWLTFLNNSGHTDQFTDKAGQLLLDAPYRKQNSTDLEPLFNLTEQWLTTIAKAKHQEL